MATTFTTRRYSDTDDVYFALAKDGASFAIKFTDEEIRQLKKVIDDATI